MAQLLPSWAFISEKQKLGCTSLHMIIHRSFMCKNPWEWKNQNVLQQMNRPTATSMPRNAAQQWKGANSLDELGGIYAE